jgi:nucleotide-binding universal stress UspA family protein
MKMTRHRASRTAPPARASRGLRRVLVALDGSPEGETVLEHLEGILAPRALVLLIHVLPAPVPSSTREVAGLLNLQEDAEQYLEDVRERLHQARSRWIVETGDPAERILAAARDEDVDAVALTTHARSGLKSLLMGSVARDVVQHAERPLFLVRPDVRPSRRALRHILVPLDGPEGAETILHAVGPMAKEADARVTLLHVLPFPLVADPVTGFNPVVLRPMELPQVTWIDPLVDLLERRGVRAEKSVLAGEPEDVLLRESRNQKADVIALRTRGRGGFRRLILGSVAEGVVRKADCPALLFHRLEE